MNHALIVIYCCLIFVLLCFSALFSCMDMAYSCASLPTLKESSKKSKRAAKAYYFASNYEETIIAPLFGNSVVNILASSLGTLLALKLAEQYNWDQEVVSLLVSILMLLLILTFGEILPKIIGRTYSRPLALLFAYPLAFLRIIFFPVVFVSKKFATALTRPVLQANADEDEGPSDDELQEMVLAINREGIIDSKSRELLSNSIEFKDTSAYEIMTPRMKIEGISAEENLNRYVKLEGAFRHSRIPVYKHDYDHIIGYIPVKSLLRAMLSDDDLSVDELIRPTLSVPRTMEISAILGLMKKSHIHLAIVKDEYGGTEGLLTMEDILEELVGEIYDEGEVVVLDIEKTNKRNVYLVRGNMNIEEFCQKFHLDPEEMDEDYETVSGWINDRLGKFGEEGDRFEFGPLTVRVKKASPYTVVQAEVTYHPRRKVS